MTRVIDMAAGTKTVLRALPGGRDGADTARDECAVSRAAVRTGDRSEPWTLPASPALLRLADAAGAAGVELELAIRLALERALACEDLRAVGVDPALVDAAAAAERVTGELDAAGSAYLRRLTQRRDDTGAVALGELVTVGLPARLSARLLRADLDALLASAEVERALAWEIAAVISGRTLGEWATVTALRALASASAAR